MKALKWDVMQMVKTRGGVFDLRAIGSVQCLAEAESGKLIHIKNSSGHLVGSIGL